MAATSGFLPAPDRRSKPTGQGSCRWTPEGADVVHARRGNTWTGGAPGLRAIERGRRRRRVIDELAWSIGIAQHAVLRLLVKYHGLGVGIGERGRFSLIDL